MDHYQTDGLLGPGLAQRMNSRRVSGQERSGRSCSEHTLLMLQDGRILALPAELGGEPGEELQRSACDAQNSTAVFALHLFSLTYAIEVARKDMRGPLDYNNRESIVPAPMSRSRTGGNTLRERESRAAGAETPGVQSSSISNAREIEASSNRGKPIQLHWLG